MAHKVNPYVALARRLEMTLARQRTAVAETELQLEAAEKMRDTFSAEEAQKVLDLGRASSSPRSK